MRARRKVTPAPPYIGRVEDMVTASPSAGIPLLPGASRTGDTHG